MWIRKRQVKTDGEKEGEEMDRIRFTSGKNERRMMAVQSDTNEEMKNKR